MYKCRDFRYANSDSQNRRRRSVKRSPEQMSTPDSSQNPQESWKFVIHAPLVSEEAYPAFSASPSAMVSTIVSSPNYR